MDGTVFICGEVEFDVGEGVRFAGAIKQVAREIDAKEAAELARIRKKLKLTQQEAALLTGGGRNAFSRYERGKAKPLQSVTNLFKLLWRMGVRLSLLSLIRGEILEQYSDDERGESCLLLGFSDNIPIHVVCGWRGMRIVIITVYVPKPSKFVDPWTRSSKHGK